MHNRSVGVSYKNLAVLTLEITRDFMRCLPSFWKKKYFVFKCIQNPKQSNKLRSNHVAPCSHHCGCWWSSTNHAQTHRWPSPVPYACWIGIWIWLTNSHKIWDFSTLLYILTPRMCIIGETSIRNSYVFFFCHKTVVCHSHPICANVSSFGSLPISGLNFLPWSRHPM